MSKSILIAAILAVAEARFGQEGIPGGAVAALSNRGSPGAAGTLSGQVPGVLLAGADACAKLKLADEIVAQLGSTADVISAALGVVAAEKNFNPFVVSVPSICGDASLPATQALRGVVPLVDPAVVGAATENANSAASLKTPFDATGISVAQVMINQGFSNFTVQDGSVSGATGGDASKATAPAATSVVKCGSAAATTAAAAAPAATTAAAAASTGSTGGKTSSLGISFGTCTPTIDFQFGRPGRKATEGTFLPTDPVVAKGQQDALNPNIITNRVCDQLINVCGLKQGDEGHTKCLEAKAQVAALGTKDASTATAFNSALGF